MRRRTTAAAGVLLIAVLSFGFSGTAQAADRDCKDFPNQAAAQAALLPGDPEHLDQNNNGVACEDYDYGSAPASTTTDSTDDSQVSTQPVGAVAAGDGSSSDSGSALPYVLGGVAFTGAAGAAVAARRSSRAGA